MNEEGLHIDLETLAKRAGLTRFQALRAFKVSIDDLDRCHPEEITEMLEAVNFLASAGECFVILGMARDPVERAIAKQYHEPGDDKFSSEQQAARACESLERARRYPEKLVNIDIQLTPPDPALLVGYARSRQRRHVD